MIVAAVVCPHPPLLLRELCGRRDAVPELRAACHEALRTALDLQPDQVLVVGGGDLSRPWDPRLPVDAHPFGTTGAPAARALPQSLGVGRRLLDEAGWQGETGMRTVHWDAADDDLGQAAGYLLGGEQRTVALVLGDGSARRGEKAPGYLDKRAFAFDDAVVQALAAGDATALGRIDRTLARDLMMTGRSPFVVLADAVLKQGSDVHARVLYSDDPYGVMYTVALWRLSEA